MGIHRALLGALGATLICLGLLRTGVVQAEDSEVPPGSITLTAVVKAKPGQEQTVKEALLPLVEPTRMEPGCLVYNLHQSKTDPTVFMFYEQWASQEALDAHGKTPHMKAVGAKLKDKTDQGGGVVRYQLLK